MKEIYGYQAVRAVLTQTPERARALTYQQGRKDARVNELIALAKEHGVRFSAVNARWFKRLGDVVHQGVVLECHEVALAKESELFAALPEFNHPPLLLVLDRITDPRNLGACIRTANAAGVDAVILPKRRSAPLSEVALKTAQGGAEGPLIAGVTNLARTLSRLQDAGLWVRPP